MFILFAALFLFGAGNEIRGNDEFTENTTIDFVDGSQDRMARNLPFSLFENDYDSEDNRNAPIPPLDPVQNFLYRKMMGGGGTPGSSGNSTSPSERQNIGSFINTFMRRLFRAFAWF